MAAFITSITDIVTGIFGTLIDTLASAGSLIFTISEAGAVTGVAPFGYVMSVLIGIPLATWAFNKLIGFVNKLRSK